MSTVCGRMRRSTSDLNEGIWYMVSLGGGKFAWVTLHIETHEKDLAKRIFDALEADQQEIESTITAVPSLEWHWRRHNPYLFSEKKRGSLGCSE